MKYIILTLALIGSAAYAERNPNYDPHLSQYAKQICELHGGQWDGYRCHL